MTYLSPSKEQNGQITTKKYKNKKDINLHLVVYQLRGTIRGCIIHREFKNAKGLLLIVIVPL